MAQYPAQYPDSHFTYPTHYPPQSQSTDEFPPPHLQPHPFLERTESEYSSSTLTHKNAPANLEDGDFVISQPPAPLGASRWWDNILPSSIACRFYLGVIILETLVDVAVEAVLYDQLRKLRIDDATLRKQMVYLTIFSLAHVFQLALAVDAVANRNTLQFVFLVVFNAVFLAYSALQSIELRKILQDLATATGEKVDFPDTVLFAILIPTIALAEIAYIGLGWQIHREFGWQVYKFLGADRAIKRMYLHYQIFASLVKFDVFFWLGFSIQLVVVVLTNPDWEYYLTILALPIALLLLVQGHLAARYENKWMMYSFMLGCLAACVYFVYKLFKIYQIHTPALPDSQNPYASVRKSLTVFASISLVFLITTFVYGYIVLSNFGAGLKDQMSKKNKPTASGAIRRRGTEHLPKSEQYAMSRTRNRMSID